MTLDELRMCIIRIHVTTFLTSPALELKSVGDSTTKLVSSIKSMYQTIF